MYLLRPRHRPVFPIVNQYPGDFLGQKAYREVRENARQLVTEGIARHRGPIAVAVPYGHKLILPSSLAGWVKTNKDLDHKQLVREDYCAGIPGFEAQSVLHDPDELVVRVIKTKMGQNDSTLAAMNASLARAFEAL